MSHSDGRSTELLLLLFTFLARTSLLLFIFNCNSQLYAGMGKKRNAYRLLVGKPEEKRLLGRPRRRWVDNIRMDLREVGWGDVDWIGLAKDRNIWRALVNSVLKFRVP
jgi:hypothetical protein